MTAETKYPIHFKNIVITAIIVIVAVVMFPGVACHQKSRQQVSSGDSAKNDTHSTTAYLDTAKNGIAQNDDPCGGTGGTGEIVSVGNKTITIKRNDGVKEIIKIGKQTKIKNSIDSLSESDLKTGYRVTVVVGLIDSDSRIASVILVCNETSQQ